MIAAPIFCTEKLALLDQFTMAVSELFRLQSAQLAAVVKGDGFQFEVELEAARTRKDVAKRAVEESLRLHGERSASLGNRTPARRYHDRNRYGFNQ